MPNTGRPIKRKEPIMGVSCVCVEERAKQQETKASGSKDFYFVIDILQEIELNIRPCVS